jgi:WD40 repeat protein
LGQPAIVWDTTWHEYAHLKGMNPPSSRWLSHRTGSGLSLAVRISGEGLGCSHQHNFADFFWPQSRLGCGFSPDGQRIVSGGWDQTARVWDAANGNELRTLVGHRRAVLSVAFSPDGQSVVTGSLDHQVKVWKATNGAVLHTLRGHGASVFSVGFSPDGKRIISGSGDQTARVWDAGQGKNCALSKATALRSVQSRFPGWPADRHGWRGGALFPDGRSVDPNIEDDPTAKVWDAGAVWSIDAGEAQNAVTSVDFPQMADGS